MKYFYGNENEIISKEKVAEIVDRHIADNEWSSVLLIPPDITRFHSGAGFITAHYYEKLTAKGCAVKVLPALGTHLAMTEAELNLIKNFGAKSMDEIKAKLAEMKLTLGMKI